MPGIGDGRKSSSLEPAGKSLSKAARGSAVGCCPAVAGGAAGAAVAWGAAVAAGPGCAAQRIKVKAAMYRIMQEAPELNCFDLRAHGRFTQFYQSMSARFAPQPRGWCWECRSLRRSRAT